jgi:hypothetical protein
MIPDAKDPIKKYFILLLLNSCHKNIKRDNTEKKRTLLICKETIVTAPLPEIMSKRE